MFQPEDHIIDLVLNHDVEPFEIPSGFTGVIHFYEPNNFKNSIVYYKNGMFHREDGPAFIYQKNYLDDSEEFEYWLEDEEYYSFEEFLEDTPQKKKALFNPQNFYSSICK